MDTDETLNEEALIVQKYDYMISKMLQDTLEIINFAAYHGGS